jgi:hypothetical protein
MHLLGISMSLFKLECLAVAKQFISCNHLL